MRRISPLIAALAVAALALAPAVADARAGGGSSFGSRGSRTWSAPPSTSTAPSPAQPFQRSITPNTPMQQPGFAPSPGYAGGIRPGGAFTSGLLGGLIGAGLGGMLMGHGFFGGLSGGGSFIGFLIQMAILFFIARWLYRRFLGGRRPSFAGMGGAAGPGQGTFFSPGGSNAGARPMPTGGGGPAGPPVAIRPADYQEFERILKAVQFAWSQQDLDGLRQLATPEMVGYFGEQLADQASRGVRNEVTDVRLLQGDLAEAWAENGREYATVAMRFSAVDVTRDLSGRIVDGDPGEHVTATEIWTFLRAPGGRWVLSGIQQTR
jgi:predicted lipid-binding transport protein (Tim44 family)